MNTRQRSGSIISAMLWMFSISLLLFWLPLMGPLLAGIVGGMKAGGVGAALIAAFLPAVIIASALFFLTTLLSGQVAFGFIASLGSLIVSVSTIGPLLIGALIGAILNKPKNLS